MKSKNGGVVYFIYTQALFSLVVSCGSNSPYKDGTYSASYDYLDGHGWKPFLDLVIKNGKITEVNFDYTNIVGEFKTKDKNYEAAMNKVNGTYPALYCPELGKRLLAKQALPVDAVTGATGSSANFNALAAAILAKAATGDTARIVLPMNDTYSATDKPDERGWAATIKLTFENNKIVKVVYNEADKDKKLKTEDVAYNTNMKKKSGISWNDAITRLQDNLVAVQSPDQVDVVSGATGTTKRFVDLARAALAQRK
jgi:major membrane immunogen (membrane-anchored lipoprotein)